MNICCYCFTLFLFPKYLRVCLIRYSQSATNSQLKLIGGRVKWRRIPTWEKREIQSQFVSVYYTRNVTFLSTQLEATASVRVKLIEYQTIFTSDFTNVSNKRRLTIKNIWRKKLDWLFSNSLFVWICAKFGWHALKRCWCDWNAAIKSFALQLENNWIPGRNFLLKLKLLRIFCRSYGNT